MALAAAGLYAQPTNGPVYWSTTQPDCSSLATPFNTPVSIPGPSGSTVYSCEVSGTFVWLAAGGEWSTAIRVAAPASAPVGVNYTFYDVNGNPLALDSNMGNGSAITSGTDVNFALYANQPAEVDLLGAAGGGPNYSAVETGSVYAQFYCPDAMTCGNVLPQLMYSALPATPWSLSVPIAWDCCLSYQWSAVGIDDGGTHRVSLVIYNEDLTPISCKVLVYDSTGTLVAVGTTPTIAAPPTDGSGNAVSDGGTWAALLSDVIPMPLPAGPFKVLVDCGSKVCAVEMLQVNGSSATAMQVAYDTAPGSTVPSGGPPVVSVTVSPGIVFVAPGATQQFTATTTGASNPALSWTVNAIPGGNSIVGTITSGGLYTAPASLPTTNTLTVAATIVQNFSASGTAEVTVATPASVGTAVKSVSSASSIPLTPLTIQTSGLQPNIPVTVEFTDKSGYSVTLSPIRVGSDGTVITGVPIYVDAATGEITDGVVSLVVRQGTQSTQSVLFEIQNLPPVSSYGVQPGEISDAVLIFNAIVAAQKLNQFQAFQLLPGNGIDTTQAQATLSKLLGGMIAARSDVDRVAANNSLVIDEGTRADGVELLFDQTSLDIMDRVNAVFLSETLGTLAASLPSAASPPSSADRLSSATVARPMVLGGDSWMKNLLNLMKNEGNLKNVADSLVSSGNASNWVDYVEASAKAAAGVIDQLPGELGTATVFNKAALGMGAAIVSDARVLGDTAGNLFAFLWGVGTRNQDLRDLAIQSMEESNKDGQLYSTLKDLALGLATGPTATVRKPIVAVGGNVLSFMIDVAEMETNALQAADQTSQSVAGEYPPIAVNSLHGIGDITGSLPALTPPVDSPEASITTPQSGGMLCGFGSAANQCLSVIGDPSGSYDLFVPLQVPGTDYASLSLSAYDPLSGSPFDTEVVDLTGLNTDTPVQVPPASSGGGSGGGGNGGGNGGGTGGGSGGGAGGSVSWTVSGAVSSAVGSLTFGGSVALPASGGTGTFASAPATFTVSTTATQFSISGAGLGSDAGASCQGSASGESNITSSGGTLSAGGSMSGTLSCTFDDGSSQTYPISGSFSASGN